MQKRIFDKTTALILLILLSPLIIISLIISFIETKSFPIFSQIRGLTIKGPLFPIYKIRTVIAQPSLRQPERRSILLNEDINNRVPKICGLMRIHGIDELLQLINVLKGEMCIIGPRPLDLYDLKYMAKSFAWANDERVKLKLKPGISGLWQLYGDRNTGAGNLIYWDKLYLANNSIAFDIKIILRTFNYFIGKDLKEYPIPATHKIVSPIKSIQVKAD